MNQKQFEAAVYSTRTLIESSRGAQAIQAERNSAEPTSPGHLSFMLAQAIIFYDEGKLEKANRWLGWVQCAAHIRFGVSLEDLKRANMAPDDAFDPERL
jgi:hypothetical protein